MSGLRNLVATPAPDAGRAPRRDAPRRAGSPIAERATAAPALHGAAIAAIAGVLPEPVVDNVAIAARTGVDPHWIVTRTGVRERHVAPAGERLSDLAAEAARRALQRACKPADEVDLVLVATTAADELTPGPAPLVAHAIGAANAGAIDVGGACNGFLSALALGSAYVEAGRADSVLVVGADLATRLANPDDRRTAPLFGDGAGAALLRRVAAPGAIGPVHLGADGSGFAALHVAHGGFLQMDGPELLSHAVERVSQATEAACRAAGVDLDDVDLFVYHQANGRILRAVGTRLGLDASRVVDCIGRMGNTSAASIPLALVEAERGGRLHRGARVLLAAFGAGYTWGGMVVEWTRS